MSLVIHVTGNVVWQARLTFVSGNHFIGDFGAECEVLECLQNYFKFMI